MNGVTRFETRNEPFRIIQNSGRGLLMQGTREWSDYRVSADVTPWLTSSAGIAARVQGMRRYYALLLTSDGHARLLKCLSGETVLSEIPFPWAQGTTHRFELEVRGAAISASIDGRKLPPARDDVNPLTGGAAAFLCEEGCMTSDAMRVTALPAGR